jgi:hypothetical protein
MDPTTVSIPLVGGPGDGSRVLVVIGPDGRPSLTMCLVGHGGLADAAVYELEALDAGPAHWCYRFRVTSSSAVDL